MEFDSSDNISLGFKENLVDSTLSTLQTLLNIFNKNDLSSQHIP
jgi:hypothetical protein